MEEDFYLTYSIHVNKIIDGLGFDIYKEENASILENLIISIDKTIVAVKSAAVLPYLKEENVKAIRQRVEKFPKKIEVKTAEDLYRLLALYVSLEDHL